MTEDNRLYVVHRSLRQGWIKEARTNGVGTHRFTLHLFGHGELANVKAQDIRFITADEIARCPGGWTLDECSPDDLCETCEQIAEAEAEIEKTDIEEIERSIGL